MVNCNNDKLGWLYRRYPYNADQASGIYVRLCRRSLTALHKVRRILSFSLKRAKSPENSQEAAYRLT